MSLDHKYYVKENCVYIITDILPIDKFLHKLLCYVAADGNISVCVETDASLGNLEELYGSDPPFFSSYEEACAQAERWHKTNVGLKV